CPLRIICTSAALGHGRTLSIAADEPLQRRLRNLSASRSGRASQRQRVAIEHRLAHHAQKQGRFARYLGLRKNLLDSRRHAAILNSKCSTRAEPRDYAGFKPFGALVGHVSTSPWRERLYVSGSRTRKRNNCAASARAVA